MPINKKAIEHFERLGRAIAANRVCEPLPRTLQEVNDRMMQIDSRSGKGTNDPMGGDLASHRAYIKFREEWRKKHNAY